MAEEPAESAAKKCQCDRRLRLKERDECASAEKSPIGGRSVAIASIARQLGGTWTTEGRLEDGSLQRTTGEVNASYTAFFI